MPLAELVVELRLRSTIDGTIDEPLRDALAADLEEEPEVAQSRLVRLSIVTHLFTYERCCRWPITWRRCLPCR